MRTFISAAMAAILWQAAAQAQSPAPVEAHTYNSGFYIGAFAGGAFLDADLVTPAFTQRTTVDTVARVPTPNGVQEVPVRVPVNIPIPSQTLRNQGGSGFVWGVRAGFGVPVNGAFYAGIEGEVTFPQAAEIGGTFMGVSYRTRLDTEGALYLRAGWRVSEDTMLYTRAGVAVPRQVANIGRSTVERWAPTPAIGLGVEHRFARRFGLRFDLTYFPGIENNQIGSLRGVIGVSRYF